MRTKEERQRAALLGAARRKERESKLSPKEKKELKEKHRAAGIQAHLKRLKNAAAQERIVQTDKKMLTKYEKAVQTRKANYAKLTKEQRIEKALKRRARWAKIVEMRRNGMCESVSKKSDNPVIQNDTDLWLKQAVALIEAKARKSVIHEIFETLKKMEKDLA